jgi:hypothetical protein
MVMTPDFHPGDPGSIPFVGDKSFLISIHIFNLVPNSLPAGYYNFQHSVRPQRCQGSQKNLKEPGITTEMPFCANI